MRAKFKFLNNIVITFNAPFTFRTFLLQAANQKELATVCQKRNSDI